MEKFGLKNEMGKMANQNLEITEFESHHKDFEQQMYPTFHSDLIRLPCYKPSRESYNAFLLSIP